MQTANTVTSTTTMHPLFAVFLALAFHRLCLGYNVDVQFPIIYSDPANFNTRSSYFGYSVILQANSDDPSKNWIQIGAPRANYSSRSKAGKEPGVVFRCHIGQPCQPLHLDFFSVPQGREYRDGAWIGGAMDIQTPEAGGRSVICGHRWTVQKTEKRTIKTRDLLGICYWMREDYQVTSPLNDVSIILELDVENERLFTLSKDVYAYKWGVGQMGSSVHFPLHTDEEIMMGVPGLYHWQGNAVHCRSGPILSGGGNQKRAARLEEFNMCTVSSIAYKKSDTYFYYMGYAVNSGRFFRRDQLVYVSGGPRAESCRGQVLLFTLPLYPNEKSNEKEMLVGATLGDYFGASLAVGDFTGDGLDDLAVGAPHCTRNHDEGCVYLYYGSDKERLRQGSGNEARIMGKMSGARFGTTLAALGDIDQDGFGDLAVGAPYENDNRGAIYIFNGALDGLSSEYSQRIGAEDFSPYLRGFGISIARPADIDHNKYTDVAVGSYISGHTVLLRGRPIVMLTHTPLYMKDSRVERNATQFAIRVCSQYTGSNVPTQLVILRTLVVDEGFKRAFIKNTSFKQRLQNFTSNLTLYAGADQCEDVEIHIHKEKMNLTDPIEIKIFQELKEKDPVYGEVIWVNTSTSDAGKDRFCKTCPILSRKTTNIENTLVVKFDLECGSDNICHAKLLLDCYFLAISSNTYKLGSNKNTLSLHVDVSNEGELAYSTQLEVLVPKPVHLFRIPINCQLNDMVNSTAVKCDVANPLRQDVKSSLSLDLDMSAVKGESGQLDFTVSVRTLSNDLYAKDNVRHLPLTVVTDASMTIAGKSINDTYSYVELNVNVSSKSVYFYHVYQVQKQGASPVEEALIDILVPTSVWNEDRTSAVNFLGMYEPESKIDDTDLQCTSDYSNRFNYLNDDQPYDVSQFLDDANVDVVPGDVDPEVEVGGTETDRGTDGAGAGGEVGGTETDRGTDGAGAEGEVGGAETDRGSDGAGAGGEMGVTEREKREALETVGGAEVKQETGEVGGAKYLLPANRTMFLNCSHGSVVCSRVRCKAGRFLGSTVVRVKIRMVLNITLLEPLMGKKDIILFASMGSVNIIDNIIGKRPAIAGVFTTFLGTVSNKEVNDWVIPVSIGIGLLLLFLTIMLLIKTGFFERKKKAELKALISAETQAEVIAQSTDKDENDGQPTEFFEFE